MSARRKRAPAPRRPESPELAAACRKVAELGLLPLVAIGEPRLVAAGTPVLEQGEPGERFLAVGSGRFKAGLRTPSGRRVTLGLYGPGDVVGFAAALAGRPQRATVSALEASGCVLVEGERLLELLARRPELIATLLPRLVRSLASCNHCPAASAGSPVEARFARLFLRLLAEDGVPSGAGDRIALRLSRRELAELGGTTIETSSRVMSDWRRREIVLTADDGFHVRDPGALRDLARG